MWFIFIRNPRAILKKLVKYQKEIEKTFDRECIIDIVSNFIFPILASNVYLKIFIKRLESKFLNEKKNLEEKINMLLKECESTLLYFERIVDIDNFKITNRITFLKKVIKDEEFLYTSFPLFREVYSELKNIQYRIEEDYTIEKCNAEKLNSYILDAENVYNKFKMECKFSSANFWHIIIVYFIDHNYIKSRKLDKNKLFSYMDNHFFGNVTKDINIIDREYNSTFFSKGMKYIIYDFKKFYMIRSCNKKDKYICF